MFNANPENKPAEAADISVAATGGYPTPPQLDGTITPEQRAAVEGAVKASTKASGSSRGGTVGLVFGAVLGAAVGLVSGRHRLIKTGIGAAAGGIGGLFLANATWKHKPDVEAPLMESHAGRLEAERTASGSGPSRA